MLNSIKKLFSSTTVTKLDVTPKEILGAIDTPRYPPSDRGLPISSVKSVIGSQSELINRIQRTAGLTKEDYTKLIEPIINNFARYVHLLPATNTGNHRGAGGLFRMGLELGLYSLQVAKSTVFNSPGSAEARYRNHPKWVFATFVAGLCSEIYRPISNMVVVVDDGAKWPQLLVPLYDWMSENNYQRYYVVWNAQNENEIGFQQANAAYLLTSIVPQSCLQYLFDGDASIMLAMTSCITGAVDTNNQISKIVNTIRFKVIKNDNAANIEHYGRQIVGAHLEPHLLDAMRRLLKDGSWTINSKGARIWYTEQDGLFIVWQAAAREILKLMEKDGRQGVPQDADTLADILINCGAAEMTDSGNRYWEIQIPVSMQLLSAIRISHPEILIQNSEIVPSDVQLLNMVNKVTFIKDTNQLITNLVNTETGEISEFSADQPESDLVSTAESDLSQNSESYTFEPQQVNSEPKQTLAKMAAPVGQKTTAKKMGVGVSEILGVAKPPASAIFNPKVSGAPKEKIIPLGSRAKELFSALKPDIKEYVHAILDDYIKGQSVGQVFCVAEGMAISTEEMNSHGQVSYTNMLLALSIKKWLWEDEDNFPNGKKLHEVEHAGGMVKVMIIKSVIAREMGFDWKIGAIK